MTQTKFEPSYTAVTKDGAEWIVAHPSIRLVGIDYLSVAHYADLIGPHIVLLSDVRPLLCIFFFPWTMTYVMYLTRLIDCPWISILGLLSVLCWKA